MESAASMHNSWKHIPNSWPDSCLKVWHSNAYMQLLRQNHQASLQHAFVVFTATSQHEGKCKWYLLQLQVTSVTSLTNLVEPTSTIVTLHYLLSLHHVMFAYNTRCHRSLCMAFQASETPLRHRNELAWPTCKLLSTLQSMTAQFMPSRTYVYFILT